MKVLLTAVDKAESEPELALAVNGWAPAAGERRLCCSTVSRAAAIRPEQARDSLGTYGRTKAAGE